MTPFTSGLRNSTATAALLITLGAPAALSQATINTNLGGGESIVISSADYPAGTPQKLTGSPTADTDTNNINIDLTISDVTGDIVTTAATATDNITSAFAEGNVSTASATLAFAPSTAGDTAAVGTLQAVEADVEAGSTSDTHSIVIENTDTGVRTFTGSALQDNNDITAGATGNTATSSITVDSGLDVIQDTGAQASVSIDESLAYAGAPNDSGSSADLVVSSSQEIDSQEAGVALSVTSTVDNGATTTFVEDLDDATLSITESDQASSVTGNTATNSIVSMDTTALITASTGIANLQSIVPFDVATIGAETTGSTISVTAGDDSVSNGGGGVADSTISLTDNTQSATATGSDSTQTLTLDASSITGEGLPAIIQDTSFASGVQLSAVGDAVIGNVQRIEPGVVVSGETTNNNIVSSMTPTDSTSVTNSTLEIDDNTQSASATGVSTSNALSLTSGATMNAAGAVASVQSMDGSVTASTTGNSVDNLVSNESLDGSSMLTTNNDVIATATGASASNTLDTTTATNNLSVESNTGSVQNGIVATEQPLVTAGQALTNDQDQSGSITATATDNQIQSNVAGSFLNSTVTTDGNSLSASATANEADNGITLAFNDLTGTIADGTLTDGVVAATANDQTLADNMTVTARNVGTGGVPVLANASSIDNSNVSTSGNTVSVSASGNVTTGNDVIVDATNVTSGSQAAPSITAGTGALNAASSFVSASTQISGADILASQLDDSGTPTTSNTIETQSDNSIIGSSVVSDNNVLSASATANRANNAVQLGDVDTVTVDASGVVANYQGTSAEGSVSAEIGIEGDDPVAAFTSGNAAPTETGTIVNNGTLPSGGDGFTNNGASPIVFTFNSPITPEEQAALAAAGFSNISGSQAEIAPGQQIDTFGGGGTQLISVTYSAGGPGTGNETLAFGSFTGSATPGDLNGAGVIARIDADGGGAGGVSGSTISVSDNTVVGEVGGNIATNAASATATTVTGLDSAATSIDASDADVAPTSADLATASLQENASALSSDVAATFAIIDDLGNIDGISNSTQIVSDNLQQSYATANRATNSVDLTATNTDADTALESVQSSTATVDTTSDLDVVANAGATNSSLEMEGNQNQSVANGNVAANTTTLDVTNATATGSLDASINLGTFTGTANNALASVQTVTENVTAAATTDVYNQDVERTGGNVISGSDVSLSSNATIAQATGNNGTQTLTLGDAGTSNMDRTGVLMNNQDVTASTVSSTVDQDVSVTLTNTASVPVQSSSLSLDGNSTTALARSNVSTNTLNVDGANIDAGVGGDAGFVETTDLFDGAYVLGSVQGNSAGVTANTTQSRVEVDMSNDDGDVIDSSTLSLSENTSSATALANTAVNSVSVGANAANVDGTAALGNVQTNAGAIGATGGSAVGLYADSADTGSSSIVGSSVMLSDNVSASNAVGNQAQNTLTASGANISSGATTSASLNAVTPSSVTADAGNLLLSDQANTGAIDSTNTANVVTINGSTVDGAGAAAEGSTLSVSGNITEAQGTANLVLNSSISIGGASTTSADATGLIGNFQFNDDSGIVTVEASTITTVSLNGAGTADALRSGSAMMQDNSTLALARGNVSQNILTAEGANVDAGTSPASVSSSSSPDAGVLNASYGVFNEQVQQAAINATSADARYTINATSGGTGDALNGASAAVGGNSINASAFGNIATNSVTLTSLNGAGNGATAAVYNGQINSGAITSEVTGARIGTFSTGGVVSASVGVSGNSISASSVGNFATSSVTRASR